MICGPLELLTVSYLEAHQVPQDNEIRTFLIFHPGDYKFVKEYGLFS